MFKFKFNIQWLYNERQRWALWIPVFIGFGITLHHYIPNIPEVFYYPALLISCGASIYFWKKSTLLLPIIIGVGLIFGGYSVVSYHHKIAVLAPIIADELGVIWIRATVDKIEQRTSGNRMLLSNLDLWQPETKRFAKDKTPLKARLNIRTPIAPEINIGDKVALRAVLSKPPKRSTFPDAYDFSYQSLYQHIGAVGFSVSPVKLYKKQPPSHLSTWIATIRQSVIEQIRDAMPESTQHIATALLAGERGAIDKKVVESIRNTGLGHLLAISGLHMALLMGGIYVILRLALTINQRLCLDYNTKKIAATIAMIAGLMYLCITGFPISAQRSYIMAGLVFTAILLDRTPSPMYLLSIAATIVLIIAPQTLFGASFQMSFAAVAGLIAFFERPIPKVGQLQANPSVFEKITATFKPEITDYSITLRIGKYIMGTLFSSFIAGIFTLPFAIYHFGHISAYSMLANMLAIPLTSLWIMPWGILSLAVLPFGAESLTLYPMHLGIELLIQIAEKVQALPQSNTLISHLHPLFIVLCTLLGLWLCIWQNLKSRIITLALLAISSLIYFNTSHQSADLIINEDGKLYAIVGADDMLYVSSLQKGRYARHQWLQMLGKPKAFHLRELKKRSPETNFSCDNRECIYTQYGKIITLVTLEDSTPSQAACAQSLLVVNLLGNQSCPQTRTITANDLTLRGTHAIYLSSGLFIDTVD